MSQRSRTPNARERQPRREKNERAEAQRKAKVAAERKSRQEANREAKRIAAAVMAERPAPRQPVKPRSAAAVNEAQRRPTAVEQQARPANDDQRAAAAMLEERVQIRPAQPLTKRKRLVRPSIFSLLAYSILSLGIGAVVGAAIIWGG